MSSDARYLVSVHEDGISVALRRTTDGKLLATVSGPPPDREWDDVEPVLAALSPRGDRLAVLWVGRLTLYALR